LILVYEIRKSTTLADSFCDLRTRKIKKPFFTQINTLLDWKKISLLIDTHYQKGESATGKPSYDGLILFKMYLL
jgi:IS5 family transposase